ncbi:MAG: bacteriocin [bacterium]|nr:bacteriocin [bacterium]
MKITDNELKTITGGGLGTWSVGAVSFVIGLVTFAIGFLDGILRPLPCRK